MREPVRLPGRREAQVGQAAAFPGSGPDAASGFLLPLGSASGTGLSHLCASPWGSAARVHLGGTQHPRSPGQLRNTRGSTPCFEVQLQLTCMNFLLSKKDFPSKC